MHNRGSAIHLLLLMLITPEDDSEDTLHTPEERAAAAARSTWVSVAVNLVLTAVQIVVGILSKSQGLVADGIHSLSDLVADFVVLLANHHAKKDADADHPYGHQRFETAASLALGLLLLGVGLGMLWAALTKLENPHELPQVHVAALWVAGAALLGKELLFRYMLAVAKRVKSSMLVANAWHARSDAASSLVVGIGIAGNLAGYPLLDPIAALIVGLMVARMGWNFAWDALHDRAGCRIEDCALADAVASNQCHAGPLVAAQQRAIQFDGADGNRFFGGHRFASVPQRTGTWSPSGRCAGSTWTIRLSTRWRPMTRRRTSTAMS